MIINANNGRLQRSAYDVRQGKRPFTKPYAYNVK